MQIFSSDDLARTYEPRGYADPAEQVHDYNRVQRYAGKHPDAGRVAVGDALDLPPSRVRGWLDDSVPDAVRGVRTAREHGWVNLDPDRRNGRAFALAVVGLYACGAVSTTWHPAWTPETPEADARLWDALTTLNAAPARRHVEDQRPTELIVRTDAAVFGRCLVAAGAPRGDKNAATVDPLPEWLLGAGERTRREAVELYLLERGTFVDYRDTIQIQTRQRSAAFCESLGRLLRSVTDAEVSVGETVVVSAAAARELGFGRGDDLRPT
ncbi:MAG: hypothetical protein ABEJ79_00360 [Halolamina sp.]